MCLRSLLPAHLCRAPSNQLPVSKCPKPVGIFCSNPRSASPYRSRCSSSAFKHVAQIFLLSCRLRIVCDHLSTRPHHAVRFGEGRGCLSISSHITQRCAVCRVSESRAPNNSPNPSNTTKVHKPAFRALGFRVPRALNPKP